MRTVLPRIGQGHNQRAVVYDPKNQLLPSLRCMGLRCPVLVGNPFDRRAVKLDLAQEVLDEAMALTLAQSLVPMEVTVHQPYFARTAQVVLSGLIQALMALYPGTWTLRHLLLVAESAERIRATLAQVPETQRYVTQHAQPDKAEETFQSVLSELGGKLEVYRPLAAAWERTSGERTIRLRQWVQQESILVLGYDPDRSGAAAAANRIILNLLAQIILGLAPNQRQKQTKNRRFFVLLDEFETLERLERIGKLLAEGRDRGVCGILGLHAWSELKQHYGADGANAIIAQISNKVFLRVEEDETEAKVLKFFGAHKRYESSVSRQHLPHGISLGVGEALREVPLLTSSELWDLPPPSREAGIQGFARTPWVGRYRMRAPFEVPVQDPYELGYDRRQPGELRLAELSAEEKRRLGIEGGEEQIKQSVPQRQVVRGENRSQKAEGEVPQRVTQGKRRAKAVTLELIANAATKVER